MVLRTVRCHPGGQSATGGQSGQEQADGPLLFSLSRKSAKCSVARGLHSLRTVRPVQADCPQLCICDADRSWRTVYSEAFQSVPGTFFTGDGPPAICVF